MIAALIKKMQIISRPRFVKPIDMRHLLPALTEKERLVLELRLPWTQQEIGDRFKVSRERVRQLEQAAMKRIVRLCGTAQKNELS